MTRKFFSKISIHRQMTIIVCTLLCFCIILGWLISSTLETLLLNNNIELANNTIEKFEMEINNISERINTVFQLLQYDSNIEDFFTSPYAANTLSLDIYFSPILGSHPEITDIALVNNRIRWSKFFSTDKLMEMEKLVPLTKVSSLGIYTGQVRGSSSTCLTFGKKIYSLFEKETINQPIGNIIISINPFKTSLALYGDDKPSVLYFLVDMKNQVISLTNTQLPQKDLNQLQDTFLEAIKHPDTNKKNSQTTIDTKDHLILLNYSSSLNQYIVSAVSKEKLYNDLRHTRALIFIICATVLLFLLIILWIIFHNIVEPMNQLSTFMHSIRDGDRRKLKNRISLSGSLEICSLSNEFNDLMTEVHTLNAQLFETTTKLYEIELQKQNAEIAHLRSQINPHFLYNTLETINGIALEHNVPQVAVISTNMGKMFRYSIKGNDTVSLSHELNISKAYLEIQSIRFENRFQILYAIDDETLECKIIKMLLQPIIENSIIHGLEPKLDYGTLFIGSKLENNTLIITIQDDGVGIDPQDLLKIQQELSSPYTYVTTQSHIGIINVHQRIHLFYGDGYGISIDSIVNTGTLITLTLPIQF